MYYIYLQEYSYKGTSYFYVGQHKWSGKGADPSYHGSSSIVHNGDGYSSPAEGWSDGPTTILEVVTKGNVCECEKAWIEHYASMLGVAPFVPLYNNFKLNGFVMTYRKAQGRLVNGCAGSSGRSSGLWWLDYYGPYSIPMISVMLGMSVTTLSAYLSKIDISDSNAQFFYHGHWIHRLHASIRVGSYSVESIKQRYESPQGKEHQRKAQSMMTQAARAKRPRYRLQDGFEGDYVEIAHHIGYTGHALKQVSAMLRNRVAIPPKWHSLQNACAIG